MNSRRRTHKVQLSFFFNDHIMSTKTKIQSVCFTITGEFMTDHARSLVVENEWENAVRFLNKSLVGIDFNTIVAVLSGTTEFTGDSNVGIGLTKKADVKYMQRLDEMYGHYVRIGQKWFVPYSYVTSYGFHDISYYKDNFSTVNFDQRRNLNADQEVSDSRARFYCKDKDKDRIFCLKCPDREMHCVLFEKIAAPPVWMDVEKTPQQAVNACRNLQEDGHLFRYTTEDLPIAFRKKYDEEDIVVSERNEDKETQEKRIELERPIIDSQLTSKFGWFSPEGQFYGCEYAGHIYMAERIVRITLSNVDWEDDTGYINNRSECILEDLGWIKVGGFGQNSYFTGDKLKATQAQQNSVYDWCTKHNERYPTEYFEANMATCSDNFNKLRED